MIEDRVGRRYARALFELALEDGSVERVAGELDALAATMKGSEELREVLSFPTNTAELRKNVFGAVADRLGTGPLVRNLVQLLIDRNRMTAFAASATCFRELADEHQGQLRGEVVSARPLSDDQLAAVRTKLEQMTGKRVLLETREDPSLIGGLVARVGNTLFDSSIRTQLEGIKRAMSDSSHG
ncbi:MAG: ATP synthase F1 subunit delta [Deltaproteobacteria bacterium]|nr:ATP synthase F1 subunit delta [Deltaproteobacteria bacterium]